MAKEHPLRRLVVGDTTWHRTVHRGAGRAGPDRGVGGHPELAAMARREPGSMELLLDILPDAFPWVRFLPEPDLHAFAVELVDTMRAADSLGNSASVAQLLIAWQHTAEVCSDPELLAALTRDHGEDYGRHQTLGTSHDRGPRRPRRTTGIRRPLRSPLRRRRLGQGLGEPRPTTPNRLEQTPETTKIPAIIMIAGISSTAPERTQEQSCVGCSRVGLMCGGAPPLEIVSRASEDRSP
ncbi:hypothetical protein WBG99_21065 [Streptomyces sp. TG1A-60]|uniref:hypothetical protein n=1 Tax=Streptomyces sp. TG1A-60 TaxID=3129111 RepID=UPI0030D092E0